MRIATFALVAVLLAIVPLAHADVAQDARFFLKNGEDFIDVGHIADRDGEILVFKGSGDSLVLIRNSTGLPLGTNDSLDALGRMTVSISDAEAAEFSARAQSMLEDAKNCRAVYDDFAKGTRGVCYETSYFKFQCSYLWTQGFYMNILPFNIASAKSAITGGLATLGEEMPRLIEYGAAFQKGDFGGAQEAAAIVSRASGAAQNASSWHQTMLSYKPFATNGALSQCKLSANDLDRMANILGSTIDVSTQGGRFEAERRINDTLQRGLTKYYNAYALTVFDQYSTDANGFSRDFADVRSARAFFTLEDDADLREQASKTTEDYGAALENMAEFQRKMENAKGRLERAKAALPEYKRSATLIESTQALARTNANMLGASADEIEKNISEVETGFILLEQSLRMNANATPDNFSELNKRMTLLSTDIVRAAASGGESADNTIFGFTLTQIIGFAVLLAAAAGLSYYYYRSRQKSYY